MRIGVDKSSTQSKGAAEMPDQATLPAPAKKPTMTPRQVKKLREKLGLLQRELAVQLGVSCRTVQGWENGRRPHGSAAKLMRDMEARFEATPRT